MQTRQVRGLLFNLPRVRQSDHERLAARLILPEAYFHGRACLQTMAIMTFRTSEPVLHVSKNRPLIINQRHCRAPFVGSALATRMDKIDGPLRYGLRCARAISPDVRESYARTARMPYLVQTGRFFWWRTRLLGKALC